MPAQLVVTTDLIRESEAELRSECQTDLWRLIHILYPPPAYQWSERVHRPICDRMFIRKNPALAIADSHPCKKRLWLDPRNHFKTTIDIADLVQWILCYPDVRILIASGTRDNAIKMLKAVKAHFQYNEYLRYFFKELCPNAKNVEDFGTLDAFTCPGRKDKTLREPTCSVASPDSTVAGMHYEVLKFDDLVNETNSRTKEGIAQVNNWFKLTNPLLERGGYRDVIGTRYDYSDLYGEILGDSFQKDYCLAELHKDYLVTKRSFFLPDGSVLFPERYDREFYEAERREMGSYNASAQYLNEPVPDSSAFFPRDVVEKSMISRDKLPKQRSYFQTLDLAASQSDDSDNNALVTCSVGWLKDAKEATLFVEDIYAGHILPETLVEYMYKKYAKFKPAQIRTEEVAFTVLLRPIAHLMAPRFGFHLPLVWIPRDTKQSKEARIAALQPFFERGQIRIVEDCPHRDALFNELVRFPKYKRRDIADALADHLAFLEMYSYAPEEQSLPELTSRCGNPRLGLVA